MLEHVCMSFLSTEGSCWLQIGSRGCLGLSNLHRNRNHSPGSQTTRLDAASFLASCRYSARLCISWHGQRELRPSMFLRSAGSHTAASHLTPSAAGNKQHKGRSETRLDDRASCRTSGRSSYERAQELVNLRPGASGRNLLTFWERISAEKPQAPRQFLYETCWQRERMDQLPKSPE